ncbi:MAG: LacI family DNA-binding transcriptional regulator, partial [Chloroflexota bacterium]
MAVTSHDVARLAGVSQATVSRALRGDTRVTVETQARVRQAVEALGYVRSEL